MFWNPAIRMMTRDQLAAELMRLSKLQLSDITRAVKNGEKSIALNEVQDLGRRLNRLADLVAARPAPAPAAAPPASSDSVLVDA
jgi:hypothetical protein